MSELTLSEAIAHCLEVAERQEKLKESKYISDIEVQYCEKCATDHRQLAEWLQELKELRSIIDACNILAVDAFAVEALCKELKEAKRLLKEAVEDFSKLDRENAKNKNCMMPEMDCADCPLNWDSVDDRIEPCHSWRYTIEALKLIWR